MGGSSSSSSTTSEQKTENHDNRVTGGSGLTLGAGSENNTITIQNSDAATLQKISGDAKEILKSAGSTSAAMFDKTVDQSTKLLDHLMTTMADMTEDSNEIALQAIAAYMPTENKMTDVAKVVGVIAAGVVVVIAMNKGK